MKKRQLLTREFLTSLLAFLVFYNVSYAQVKEYASSQTWDKVNCADCEVTNPANDVTTPLTDFAVLDISTAVNGYVYQVLQFATPGSVGDSLVIAIQDPDGQLDASALGGLKVYLMSNATTHTADSMNVVDVPSLTVINGVTQVYGIVIRPTETYDRIKLKFSSGAGLLTKLNVYYAYKVTVPAQNLDCKKATKTQYGKASTCAVCEVVNPTLAVDVEENTYSTLKVDVSAANAYTEQFLDFVTLNTGNVTLIVEYPGGPLTPTLLGNLWLESFNNATSNSDGGPVNRKNVRAIAGSNKYEIYLSFPGTNFTRIKVRLNGGAASSLSELRIYAACRSVIDPIDLSQCDLLAESQLPATGGTINGSVINPSYSVDGNAATASTLDLGISNAGYVQQTLYFTQPMNPGDSVLITVEAPGQPVSGSTSSNVSFSTLLIDNPNNDDATLDVNSLNLVDGTNKYVYVLRPVKPFDAVRIKLNGGTAGALIQLNIYEACVKIVEKESIFGAVSLRKCQTGATQDDNSSGLLASVLNPENVVDADPNNFSVLKVDAAAIGYAEQIITFTNAGCKKDYVNVILEDPTGLMDAHMQGNISVLSYSPGGASNNDEKFIDRSNIKLADGTTRYVYKFLPGAAFKRIRVRLNGGQVAGLTSVNLFEVLLVGIAPPQSKDTTVCYGTPATLIATAPANARIDWFASETGGTPLTTGSTYTTPPLTDTVTYYLQSTRIDTSNCPNLCRVPVTVNVRQMINIPVAPDTMVVCKGETTVVTPNLPGVAVFRFFPDTTSTAPLAEGADYTTPALFTDTVVYAAAVLNGCESQRKRIVLDVVDRTPDPIVADTFHICAERQATLTVTGPAGAQISWFADAAGGIPIAIGNTYITPVLFKDSIFYVESFLSLCGVSDNRLPVYVKVAPLPPAPVLSDTLYFCGTSATFLANNSNPDINFTWWDSLENGTLLYTGNPFSTTLTQDTTVFYVQSIMFSCPSKRVPVVAISNVVPAPPLIKDTLICAGQSITLIPDTTVYSGALFNWYNAASGGTLLQTSKAFTTGMITDTTTLWVQTQLSNCVSSRIPVNIFTKEKLAIPLISCDNGSATTNSVTFTWGAVPNATGYLVSTDTGLTYNSPSSGPNGTTHTVTVANQQEVTIQVIALGPLPCGNSEVSAQQVCKPNNCAPTDFKTDENPYICAGESLTLTVDGIQSPDFMVQWDNNPPTTDTFYTVSPTAPTTYLVQVFNPNQPGCDTTKKLINVGINPDPIADFTSDKEVVIVPDGVVSFHENTVGSTQWYWDFGDGATSNEQNPVHKYSQADTFTVMLIASNAYGCSDTTIKTLITEDAFNIFIPNSFTPNKDSRNDVLYVRGKSVQAVFFRLYNQWGQLLFETDDLGKGWDGTFNGMEQPVGVYVYYCDAVSKWNEKIAKKGSITLLR